LDPHYELVEDTGPLADERFQSLIQAAEARTLGALLRGSAFADRADEAIATILDARGHDRRPVPAPQRQRRDRQSP
jgi:hypothetical protein